MLTRALETNASLEQQRSETERYLRRTYCDRFAKNGWVYADGTLALDAYRWAEQGHSCVTARPGQVEAPRGCDARASSTLDCALLHHVRRSEVQAFVATLPKPRPACDDRTPLGDLGA